jgi:hypothetical protein
MGEEKVICMIADAGTHAYIHIYDALCIHTQKKRERKRERERERERERDKRATSKYVKVGCWTWLRLLPKL